MIEQGIYGLLTNNAGVSALVGAKVYFVLAPKMATLPYIVITRVATEDTYTMAGASGIRNSLFHMNCFATDYYTSRSISLAVRTVLENYRGNLPDSDSTAVGATFTAMDNDQPYQEGGPKGFVYQAMLQFRLWYYDSTLPITTPSAPPAVIDGGTV